MQIIYHKDKNKINSYLEFIKKKYSNQKNFNYFFIDLQSALAFSFLNKNQKVLFIDIKTEQETVGHVGLIIDTRLKNKEAFFGFFESLPDNEIFNLLWRELINLAKSRNIKVLKGPINGSPWYQYRVVSDSDGSPFFKTEMFCDNYYYNFFKSVKPAKEIFYYSAHRIRFESIISATKFSYKKLSTEGFIIEEIKDIAIDQLKSIWELSKKTFKNYWGYVDLSFDDFISLYLPQKLFCHLNKIYFLKKQDQVIGFLSTLREDNLTLIFKTICILPEFQGLGLGNMLVYKAHLDAKKDGFKKIIYALIQTDNNIRNFPKDDAIIFRNYSTFEFDVL